VHYPSGIQEATHPPTSRAGQCDTETRSLPRPTISGWSLKGFRVGLTRDEQAGCPCRPEQDQRLALQLERDEERVVILARLLQLREREPGSKRDAEQVGQGQMVHADPGTDPLAEPGAGMVPATLAIAGDGADAPRWGAAPRTG
jgi:hypothetical protein